MTDNTPWIHVKAEGLLGQWHMPAGHSTRGLVLVACDQTFTPELRLEERAVGLIPANERCPVCQGLHAATQRNRT
jgi:hypothetical protein